jgi:hypothetical protein
MSSREEGAQTLSSSNHEGGQNGSDHASNSMRSFNVQVLDVDGRYACHAARTQRETNCLSIEPQRWVETVAHRLFRR